VSCGDRRWFKRSTREKRRVTRDNEIIIIIIIIIIIKAKFKIFSGLNYTQRHEDVFWSESMYRYMILVIGPRWKLVVIPPTSPGHLPSG
jgi:hypothetical protein